MHLILHCHQVIGDGLVMGDGHIKGGVLDLVLSGVRVDSPIGIADHSILFIDVVLEQPIPH